MGWQRVALASSWGWVLSSPLDHPTRTSPKSAAPTRDSFSLSKAVLSLSATGTCARARMGPLSIPSSRSIILTPVNSSPARMAATTGDAPRNLGNSEGWTLTQPSRGNSRTALGKS